MTRTWIAIPFLMALRLSGQDTGVRYLPHVEAPGELRQIAPIVQVGDYLREQSTLGTPGAFSMHGPGIPAGRSFTVESTMFPGQYSVRDDFNPMSRYTVSVQPGNSEFTIRNDQSPASDYRIRRQPAGNYTVENQHNFSENYKLSTGPSYDLWEIRRPHAAASWPNPDHSYPGPNNTPGWERPEPPPTYSIQNGFTAPDTVLRQASGEPMFQDESQWRRGNEPRSHGRRNTWSFLRFLWR